MTFNNALPLVACQTPISLPCFADKEKEIKAFNAIPYGKWQSKYQEFQADAHDLNHRGYRAQVGFLLDLADKGFIRRSVLADAVVDCCPTDKRRLSRLVDLLQVDVGQSLAKHFLNEKERVSSLFENFDGRSETDFLELSVLTHPCTLAGSLLSGMDVQSNERGLGLVIGSDDACYYHWATDGLSEPYQQWIANLSEVISHSTHAYSQTGEEMVDSIESWDVEELRTTMEANNCKFHCDNFKIECNYNYYGGSTVYIDTTHHSDFFAMCEDVGLRKAMLEIMKELMVYPESLDKELFLDEFLEANPYMEQGEGSDVIEAVLTMAANDALKAKMTKVSINTEVDVNNIAESRMAIFDSLMPLLPEPETELDVELQQFMLKLLPTRPESLFDRFDTVEVDERPLSSQNYLVVGNKEVTDPLGYIATNLANMECESGVSAFNYTVDPDEAVSWLENLAWVHSVMSTVDCLLRKKR